MEVTKTNAEWKEIYHGLQAIGRLKSLKLQYAADKNSNKIESHMKSLEKLLVASPEFEEYDKKRVAIIEKHADKDADGMPIIEGNVYKVDPEVVKPEVEELEKEYKEAVDARQEQIKQFMEIMEEDFTFDVHPVSLENVPSDINGEEFKKIKFMLSE